MAFYPFKAVFAALFIVLSAPALAETRLMAFGDSLTAGLGLPIEQSFASRLEAALRARKYDVTVINAGVSGDTTSGALSRLEFNLQSNPDCILVEIGANDMLRAVPPEVTRTNMDQILSILKARKIEVLLAGMKAPYNLGFGYVKSFEGIYTDMAEKYDTLFYPFFLKDVATKAEFNQDDGHHPNAAGVEVIVANILPEVEKLRCLKGR